MRWLAVDPGDKHIGLAISDPTGTVVRPLTTLSHESYALSAKKILTVAHEQKVQGIIVGLPLDEDGWEGPQARKAGRLAEALREVSSLTVVLHDESLSSREAHRLRRAAGKKKRLRDNAEHAHAAAVILQSYLDEHTPTPKTR
jgi:putative Holliday junction resolvase